jgi:tetratricopeptide (TPR) repeat protein
MRWIITFCIGVVCAAGADWTSLMELADAREHAGNYKEAAVEYEAAMRIADKFDANDSRIPTTWNKLAVVYDSLGRYADAGRLYRRALTWVERVKGKTSPEYGTLLNNVAGMYLEQGRFDEAEPLIRQAIAIGIATLPADDPRLAVARSGLADVLIKRGRYRESEQLLNDAIHAFEHQPDFGRDLGIARNNLAVVKRAQKRHDEARQLLERAIVDIETDGGPDHPALARVLNNLGTAYAALGRPQEADQAFRRSIAIAGERLGTQSLMYGVMLHNYAVFLRHDGRKAESKTLEAQSQAVIHESALTNAAGKTVDVSAFRGQ